MDDGNVQMSSDLIIIEWHKHLDLLPKDFKKGRKISWISQMQWWDTSLCLISWKSEGFPMRCGEMWADCRPNSAHWEAIGPMKARGSDIGSPHSLSILSSMLWVVEWKAALSDQKAPWLSQWTIFLSKLAQLCLQHEKGAVQR